MSELKPIWLWEETPAEVLRNFVVAHNGPTSAPVQTRPFECARRELGDGLQYQVALSDSKSCREAAALRAAQPEIPASGDRRSGVLVLDGDRVVGSYLFDALGARVLQVLPSHRGRKISRLLFAQYFKEVKVLSGRTSIVNTLGLKAFVAAFPHVVRQAVDDGRDVPKRVLDAVAAGKESEFLLRRVGLAA